MRMLLVEDEFVSRNIMKEILTQYGRCDAVDNGREAIEMFKISINQGEIYDLVCLDIMLPEMSGQLVLQGIRDLEKEAGLIGVKKAKIIMTTTFADSATINKSFDNQCDGYLVKPVNKQRVYDALKQLDMI